MKRLLLFSSLIMVIFTLSACGGGGGSDATPPYSQADLAGTWYASILQTGPSVSVGGEPGWIRGTLSIASSGTISAPVLYTSSSVTPISVQDGIVWTIDPWTGMVSESSGTAVSDFEGRLASSKKLLIGVSTGNNNAIQLRVLQKIDTSATCTISDIANKSFWVHQIENGAGSDWMYAKGQTDPVVSEESTTVTLLTPVTKPSGTDPGGIAGYLSIDASGLVSLDTNSSFKGMLSSDKTYMIATETEPTTGDIYRLAVVQFIDPAVAYSVADLAGTWRASTILTGGAWIAGTPTMDSTGHLTMPDQHDNFGNDHGLITVDFTMSDPGVYSDPTSTSMMHSFLSSTKDFLVMTQTLDFPFTTPGGLQSSMSIIIK